MNFKSILRFVVFILPVFVSIAVNGQITAPGSAAGVSTQYPSFPETDNVYIFCAQDEGVQPGSLVATTALQGTKTYTWEKFNPATGTFELYYSESLETQQSTLTGLENGGYRVVISIGDTEEIYRAWVFN